MADGVAVLRKKERRFVYQIAWLGKRSKVTPEVSFCVETAVAKVYISSFGDLGQNIYLSQSIPSKSESSCQNPWLLLCEK